MGWNERECVPHFLPSSLLGHCQEGPGLCTSHWRPCSGLPLASTLSVGQRVNGHREHAHLETDSPLLDHAQGTQDPRILCQMASNILPGPTHASSPYLPCHEWTVSLVCIPHLSSVTGHWVAICWVGGRAWVSMEKGGLKVLSPSILTLFSGTLKYLGFSIET